MYMMRTSRTAINFGFFMNNNNKKKRNHSCVSSIIITLSLSSKQMFDRKQFYHIFNKAMVLFSLFVNIVYPMIRLKNDPFFLVMDQCQMILRCLLNIQAFNRSFFYFWIKNFYFVFNPNPEWISSFFLCVCWNCVGGKFKTWIDHKLQFSLEYHAN